MKRLQSKWLRSSVAAALMAGSWWLATPAQAAIVDMTDSSNLGGVTIENPVSDVDNIYVYKWDSANKILTGGDIDVVDNEEGKYITTHLVVKASDLQNMSAVETKAVLNALTEKIFNKLPSQRWKLYAYVDVVDDPTGTEMQKIRSYKLSFEGDEEEPEATLGNFEGGIYTTPAINDGNVDSEYEFDSSGTWHTQGGNVQIIPDFSEKTGDNIYAVVRSADGKNLTITNKQGNTTYTNKLTLNGDASVHGDSHAYGIYNDGDSQIELAASQMNITTKGKKAVGIYAGNASEAKKSLVKLNGKINITLEGTKTTGIEAGKNGEITRGSSGSSYLPEITIAAPLGYALYAHDGGKIDLDKVNVPVSASDALFAEKGGNISIGSIKALNGSVKTDEEDSSKITLSVEEKLEGDVLGHVDLTLKPGSVWDGANNGLDRLTMNGSSLWNVRNTAGAAVKNLKSDNGVIRMNKNGAPVTIGDLDGSVNFSYERDAAETDKILGGKATISKAAANSAVTVFTDRGGLESADEATLGKVLDHLAEKLYYTAYTTGEKNIVAQAKIAEGLTSASVSKYFANLTFDETTGQAKRGELKEIYTDPITFSDADTFYKDKAIASSDYGKYTFDKDVIMDVRMGIEGTPIPEQMKYGMAIAPKSEGDHTIDLKGHDLSLAQNVVVNTMNQITTTNICQMPKGTLTIENPGHINLENWTDYYYAGGIAAGGRFNTYAEDERATVHIKNDNSWDHRVSMTGTVWGKGHGSPTNTASIFWINYTGLKTFDHGNIFIDGLVDINTNDAWCVSGIGDHSIISLGGGNLHAKHYTSVDSYNKGTVNINLANGQQKGEAYVPGSNKVNIQGNLRSQGQWVGAGNGGYINVALTTPDSTFHGRADSGTYEKQVGWTSLWLQNGATWTNFDGGFQYGDKWTYAPKGDSVVENFAGGADEASRGVIYQKYGVQEDSLKPDQETGASNLYLKNYSGHTLILMDHGVDKEGKYAITSGNVQVDHANKDSAGKNAVITLRTDNTGIAMTDSERVNDTLNLLANKLYYAGFAKTGTEHEENLDGKVEIAEGLTAQSAGLKLGDVTFKQDGQGIYESIEEEGPITQTTTLASDRVVTWTEPSAEGKYVSTLYSEGSTSKQNPMVVDLNGHKLELNANSSSKIPAAIYVGNNHYINIENHTSDKKLSIVATNTDTRAANGIRLEGNSHLNLNGPVEINQVQTKGDAAIGIHFQGKDSEVTIHGPLKISDVEGLRGKGNGINATGILVTGDRSKITVAGPVDIAGVKGSGLKTTGADTEISVGGGTITAAEDHDHSKNYHAARVDKGTININMEGAQPGSTITKITGDLFATGQYGQRVVEYSGGQLVDWADAGVLNVALTNNDSFWKGAAVYDNYTSDYGSGGKTVHDVGKLNLYLQNGAQWTNQKQSHGTTTTVPSADWTGSVLASLSGGSDADHAGIVIQKEETPISIMDYSGHTTLIYAHEGDGTKAENYKAGNTLVKKAAAGSSITVLTDKAGIDTASEDKTYEALNALAGKLWYEEAKTDGTNLSGKAKIAEGLTASSAEVKLEDITFKKEDGQGMVAKPTPPPAVLSPITGDKAKDVYYVENGILETEGTYNFKEDTELKLTDGKSMVASEKAVTINASGKTLGLVSEGVNGVVTLSPQSDDPIQIVAKKLSVKALSTGGNAYGLSIAGKNQDNARVTNITGDVDIAAKGKTYVIGAIVNGNANLNIQGNLAIKGENNGWGIEALNTPTGVWGYHYTSGLYAQADKNIGKGGQITVDGDIDFKVRGTGLVANGYGSSIQVKGGGVIEVEKNDKAVQYALMSQNGAIKFNMNEAGQAGERKVNILGNIGVTNAAVSTSDPTKLSEVDLGLGTEDSSFTGVVVNNYTEQQNNTGYAGKANLYIKNGAVWTNSAYGMVNSGYEGSKLSLLSGGSDGAHAGIVFQKEGTPISIMDYSGHTVFIYDHETALPADPNTGLTIIGGDTVIKKAASGSGITLLTDNTGLNTSSTLAADKNLISGTLNALANKLYYTAYKDGERNLNGTVKISEGLTAQSAELKVGPITFKDTDGQGQYLYTPEEDIVVGPIKTPEVFTADRNAAATVTDLVGTGSKKFVAAAYNGTADSDMLVDMNGKSLILSANAGSEIIKTAGIMADGKNLSFRNGKEGSPIHITAVTAGEAAGIMARSAGNVLVDHDIVIDKVEGARKAYGVVTTNPNDKIRLKGLKISQSVVATKDTMQQGAVGIAANGNGAEVNVIGPVDISLKGIGIKAMGGTARIAGGKIVTDTDTSKYHKALISENSSSTDGAIAVNMNEENTAAANHKVEILGDIFTKKSKTGDKAGRVFLGLNTGDSSWQGITDYLDDANNKPGEVNLWLSNGAVWKHEKTAATGKHLSSSVWNGSRLTSMHGSEGSEESGVVFQNESHPITIDDYSGNVTFIYKHDTESPGEPNTGLRILGGNTIIKKAAIGSGITLLTDNAGLNTSSTLAADKNLVSGTLNGLANKLYYTAYKNGEKNLTGTVKIAEGLTAQSVELKTGPITFKDVDGKGQYLYTPAEDEVQTQFSRAITGGTDQYYVDAGVKQADGTYKFVKDSTIAIGDEILGETTPITANGGDKVIVDAEGTTLTLHSVGKSLRTGIATNIKNNKTIDITADKLIINAENTGGMSRAYGIWYTGNNSTLDVHGDTDITTNGSDWSYGILSGMASKVNLQGLKVAVNKEAKESGALKGSGNSMISVNVKDGVVGNHKVQIDGDVITQLEINDDGFGTVTQTGPSTINLALTSAESFWNGSSVYTDTVEEGFDEDETITKTHGDVNLWLQNGARWTNARSGKQDFAGYKGSYLTKLVGGADTSKSGVILQKDAKDITIGDYSGQTLVIYEHKADLLADPNTGLSIVGGHTVIKKAAPGSGITLLTDNAGLKTSSTLAADRNLVSGTLNALANKLYYTAYKSGEKNLTGTVKIAEGLTAQSAELQAGPITFKEADGQGQYLYTPAEDHPTHQIKTEFGTTLDGIAAKDKEYIDGGVRQVIDGKPVYNFTENSTITVDDEDFVGQDAYSNPAILGNKNTTIDINIAEGKTLKLIADSAGSHWADGITALDGSKTTINGDIEIHAAESGNGSGTGIRMTPAGTSQGVKTDVIINGKVKIRKDDPTSPWAIGNGVYASYGTRYQATGLFNNQSKDSLLQITGPVDLAVKGTAVAVDDYYDGDAVIDLAGGRIETPDDREKKENTYLSLAAYSGTINLNYDAAENKSKGHKVELIGNTLVIDAKDHAMYNWLDGKMNIALDTADSYWNGAATNLGREKLGEFNLVLKNGATWDNQLWSKGWDVQGDPYTGGTFDGISHVTKLTGGKDAADRGIIKMSSGDVGLEADDYHGHMLLIYAHETTVPEDSNTGLEVIGGNATIHKAAPGSGITLLTDNAGLNTSSSLAADKNLVSGTLNRLANKLYYTAYKGGEKNLTGTVKVAEGLTAQSAELKTGPITFKAEDGQGQYLYTPAVDPASEQDIETFGTAITGDKEVDREYVIHGVLKDDVYTFTKPSTTIATNGASIPGGPWMPAITAAISGSAEEKKAIIDLKGNSLIVDTDFKATTGISGIGTGKVEINNAGAMSVNGQRAAIYANGGGTVLIHNGGENPEAKILTLRAGSNQPQSVAVVKTMNGAGGVTSNITIDGLVDVLADGQNPDGMSANEAVSAVASEINIGGGTIRAINGAWAAIRAYGEFVSDNYGTVNLNVTKGEDGLANGAGNMKTVLEGDIVTNGGMGTKGRISVGLSTADSHWIGNYADTRGYGVTQGQLGAVNLFMKNGSYWKGFGNGTMNVNMTGAGTQWTGFNIGENMQLTLQDGATWHNAITKDQKDQSGNAVDSKVKYFTGDNGVIDMTGARGFVATSNSLSGNPTQGQSSAITEAPDSETGNLLIDNYSGSSTVIYKHEIAADSGRENAEQYGNKAAKVIGGNTTIQKAAEDSSITLLTDNTGLDMSSTLAADKNLISDTLNALANKLYYTGFANEGEAHEANLVGTVKIAEGLTAQSAELKTGPITYKAEDGQGQYLYTLAVDPASEQDIETFGTAITGDKEVDREYVIHGVLKDDIYTFTKDVTNINASVKINGGVWELGETRAAVSNTSDTLPTVIDLKGHTLNINSDYFSGIAATTKGSHVVINNPGAININVGGENKNLYATGIYANSGGVVDVHNGGMDQENKILKIRAGFDPEWTGGNSGIKARNGMQGEYTTVNIDGLVDIEVDGDTSKDQPGGNTFGGKTALAATASQINIGGGSIKVKNGYAALWCYGEFVSSNEGSINLNVKKDEEGNVIGAGTNRLVVEGDVSTRGGMGSKGRARMGLSTPGSYWLGNYTDSRGYGVSPGQLGSVNLYIKNGGYWKGFSDGVMDVIAEGSNSYWTGFNIGEHMTLTLQDGATWHNAITKEQKNVKGELTDSKLKIFTGDNGVIDMTGARGFVATSNSLSGNPTQGQSSAITEAPDSETGNLLIDTYRGSSTVLYKHEIVEDSTREKATLYGNKTAKVLGGNTTIRKAAAGSSITLLTDTIGLNTESTKAVDKNIVSDTLNALANKLYYEAHVNGEQNLTGKVEIAEGLTAQSASQRIEDITYKAEDGQGQYLYTPAVDEPEPQPQPEPEPQPQPEPEPQPQPEPEPQPQPEPEPQPQPEPEPQPQPEPEPQPQPEPEPQPQPEPGPQPQPPIIYGDKETVMMRGAKTAMTSSVLLWRTNNNDLQRRMGDVRIGKEDNGIWARYLGGKNELDQPKTSFKQTYHVAQVGFDKKAGNWLLGAALDYGTANDTYATGSGKGKLASLALYGTQQGKDGQYVDLIVRGSQVKNDYTVRNEMGHKLDGDYKTWGLSVSAEYGKRFVQSNGFYVDPSLELTAGHLNGTSYDALSDYAGGKKMHIQQDGMNSVVGRLGLGIGRETETSNVFAKVALAHEFGGKIRSTFSAVGEPTSSTEVDLKDSWIDLELGGSWQVNKDTYLYGTYTRNFGADLSNKWRVDAGVRFSF